MKTLEEEASDEISKLSEMADIDDIMYKVYVIDKVKKGQEAANNGEVISVESLKTEMQSWSC